MVHRRVAEAMIRTVKLSAPLGSYMMVPMRSLATDSERCDRVRRATDYKRYEDEIRRAVQLQRDPPKYGVTGGDLTDWLVSLKGNLRLLQAAFRTLTEQGIRPFNGFDRSCKRLPMPCWWDMPKKHRFKINFDGSYRPSAAWWAAIMRDDKGCCIGSVCRPIYLRKHYDESTRKRFGYHLAELRGFDGAISLAKKYCKDYQLNPHQLEVDFVSDCQQVIQMVNGEIPVPPELKRDVDNIRQRLKEFPMHACYFQPRETNRAADFLIRSKQSKSKEKKATLDRLEEIIKEDQKSHVIYRMYPGFLQRWCRDMQLQCLV